MPRDEWRLSMRTGLKIRGRLALAATALAPVWFTYAFVALFNKLIFLAILFVAIAAVLVILCICILNQIINKDGVNPNASAPEEHPFTTVEPADHENFAIILVYVMPLFSANLEDLNWKFWIPTLILFIIIATRSNSYSFNPLLALFGWHFYRVGTPEQVTRLVISKQKIIRGGGIITGIQLSEYVIIDVKEALKKSKSSKKNQEKNCKEPD